MNLFGVLSQFRQSLHAPQVLLWLHYDYNIQLHSLNSSESLHRSIVVLCVASWQSFVEDLCRELLGPPPMTQLADHPNSISNYIDQYSTPNSQKTERIFQYFSINVLNYWNFNDALLVEIGNSLEKQLLRPNYDSVAIKSELDMWVQLRHMIAHGDVVDLTELRAHYTDIVGLNRVSSHQCLNFFYNIGLSTIKGISSNLSVSEQEEFMRHSEQNLQCIPSNIDILKTLGY